MLDWLKKLLSPRNAPEVEYDPATGDRPAVLPSGPPAGHPAPAVPVERPAPEEPDRQP